MHPNDSPPKAAPFLERALLFVIFTHGLGMLTMVLLLLPGMPGGPNEAASARAAYIVDHPWLWRLGWLPWQLSALADLLLAVALMRTRWIPRWPAVLTLLATIAAILIQQSGEFRWITDGVTLAREAVRIGTPDLFRQFEADLCAQVAGWGALFCTITALFWTWAFSAARTWKPLLSRLSVLTWSILLAVAIATIVPEGARPSTALITAGNAVGFLLLMLWLILVTECVLRRARPTEPHGRQAPWRYPRRGLAGFVLDAIANSRLARAVGEWFPPVAFVSDITDVIYINYLVDADMLQKLVPLGLELDRLGRDGRFAFFTFLTYRHGHFGPGLLGPLRRLMPSPVQSNWRIYVRQPRTGVSLKPGQSAADLSGVYFVTTAITGSMQALAARLLAEGMAMHVPARGEVLAHADGSFQVVLDPGKGSAPDVHATLHPAAVPQLPKSWHTCFPTYRDMLAYCVPQDRAMSSQPWYRRITRQEIQLGIPLENCKPLEGEVESRAARAIAGEATPVCFRVPRVSFRFDRVEYSQTAI
jgi:hypothetical protein